MPHEEPYTIKENEMRYMILKPRELTFDPRDLSIPDMAKLHDLIPPIADCPTEVEAKYAIRKVLPNAQGVPFPIKIGSGHAILLGFIEDPSCSIDHDDMPFAIFVQAITQTEHDRKKIGRALEGKERIFDKDLWKLRPVRPQLSKTEEIEWRTSENDTPVFLDAQVGYDVDGRLLVFAEMGNHSFSIKFRSTALVIRQDDVVHDPASGRSFRKVELSNGLPGLMPIVDEGKPVRIASYEQNTTTGIAADKVEATAEASGATVIVRTDGV